jgi:hypothetical protein
VLRVPSAQVARRASMHELELGLLRPSSPPRLVGDYPG